MRTSVAIVAALSVLWAFAEEAPHKFRKYPGTYHFSGDAGFALQSGLAKAVRMAAADFDGDGVKDLAVLYEYSGQGILAIFHGHLGKPGDAPFAHEVQATLLPEAADLLVAKDINDDGLADVVVGIRGSHRLHYLKNQHAAEFARAKTIDYKEALVADREDPLRIAMQFRHLPGMTYATISPETSFPMVIADDFASGYTIDDSRDFGDPNVGTPGDDGICNSYPTSPNGVPLGGCTLRSAIQNANFHGFGVNFSFSTNVVNLTNGSELIQVPAIVDGTTAPGGFVTITCSDTASGGTIYDPIAIHLVGGNPIGFIPGSPSVARLVKGFHIGNCATGIRVTNAPNYPRINADGAVILQNQITGRTNQNGQPLGYGIISQSAGNTIGDPNLALTNYISSVASGIFLSGSGDSNAPNDGSGQKILGNQITGVEGGVEVSGGALGTQIGGTNAGEGNYIDAPKGTAFHAGGILVYDTGSANGQLAQSTQILGNKIGTNGTAAGLTKGYGISMNSSFATIGGATASARNLIAVTQAINGSAAGIFLSGTNNQVQGNYLGVDQTGLAKLASTGVGIYLGSGSTTITGNVIGGFASHGMDLNGGGTAIVKGNLVGVNKNGTAALGNGGDGIHVGQVGTGSQIGGENAGDGNVLSGNLGAGLSGDFDFTQVKGNKIGVDITATAAIPNHIGVNGGGVGNPVLGGSTAAAANIIAGNSSDGVVLNEGNGGMTLQGNYIGTTPAGATNLGNGGNGVHLECCINYVLGNTIQHNGLAGIAADFQQPILGNSIFANGGLGITYPAVNFLPPVITSASSLGSTVVAGTVSASAADLEVEVFASTACDPSGFGEGQTYLGRVAASNGTFSFTSPVQLAPGMFATATLALSGSIGGIPNTSTFSNCVTVAACAANVTAQVSVARGALRLNRTTGRYTQTIHVTNNGTSLTAPLALTFDSLTAGVTLYQPSGTTSCTAPASPYALLPAGLSQNAGVDVNVEFSNPSNGAISYTNRLLAGSNR